jgi:diguanylate cyclase (GGDEF)-like protein
VTRKPRHRRGAGPPTRGEVSDLRGQASAARLELGELRAHIALAQQDLSGTSTLQRANEELLCNALKAQADSDDCRQNLREAARASERDPLTALPNRTLLLDRLVHAIARSRRRSERLAVLFVDLDGFKQVNDNHGHAAGDEVLQQVAQRLLAVVREEDTVSRHGGDEFLILLEGVESPLDAVAMADTLVEAVAVPIRVDGVEVRLGISVGISLFPDHAQQAGRLIECADAAMYVAKRSGGRCALAGDATGRTPAYFSSKPPAASTSAGEREMLRTDRRQSLLCDANERLLMAALDSRQSQDAAETAHRLQRENLAVVAHELRGPLSPMKLAAALLPRVKLDELPRVQAIIERGVTQMTRLVGDLLDLSRVHTGKLRLELLPIDLRIVLEDVVEGVRAAADARGQSLALDLPAGPLRIWGDAVRLTQVFRNLLDNSVKYTPVGGSVRLEARECCGLAEVSVCDTGIGIALESLQRVFEPFAQDPRAVGFDSAGLGIGLTVVRELVEGHAGHVVACSDGPGKGSRFVVTLPLADPAERVPAAA